MTLCCSIYEFRSARSFSFAHAFCATRNEIAYFMTEAHDHGFFTFMVELSSYDYDGDSLTAEGQEKLKNYIRQMIDGGYLK